MKINKIISIVLIFLIIFTSLPVQAIDALKYFKYGTPSNTKWDDALHFMIRHWHVVEDTEVKSIEEDDHYFVVIEGYIVPKEDNSGYEFYYVDQESGNISDLDEGMANSNSYISSIDKNTGTIKLPVKNVKSEDGGNLEHFSGISVSAGHGSIDANDEKNEITITYHQNVHLVKAHVFYSDEKITVYGSGKDDAVFGTTDQTDLEKDTAWVYTYKESSNGHNIGDVVKGQDGNPVFEEKDILEADKGKVEKNKVYSTLEGLHTDKTASAIENEDRKFNLDLEAWYSGAPLADVGLVLDASGSMGFTSDDLTPININNLELTKEQKSELESKKLIASKYSGEKEPTNKQWMDEIFLDEDDVNLMLNPHNTDNSKLSASDYSYFIFDPRNTVNEYVPLGYWDGSIKGVKDKLIGYYEFNKGSYTGDEANKRDWLINSVNGKSASLVKQIKVDDLKGAFEKVTEPNNWKDYKSIKMNGDKGLNIKNDSDAETTGGGVGVLLDAKPTSENFTISFSIEQEAEKTKSDTQKYTDILYIGSKDSIDSNNYRSIRDGNGDGSKSKSGSSSNRFRGYNKLDENEKQVTNINSVFSSSDKVIKHTITLVFKGGKVTSYLDGTVGKSSDSDTGENTQQEIELSDYDIIFKGFDNNYNGSDLYVDNIAVFDTALTEDEVSNIESILKSEESKYTICNECFLDDNSEESIGVVSKYFVGLDGGTPGWYYVNYDSEWEGEYFNQDIQSCKRYWGIPKSGTDEEITFTDEVNISDEKLKEQTNTKLKYKPEKDTPVEFYIDDAGYLRCFFTSSTKKATAHASYVYYKEDSKYVKTEALQRALGSFTTMLDEVSPDSKISAVRFSTEKIKEESLDTLVLLDWTDDPIEAQDIMSLERGEGGTIEGTDSAGDFKNTEGKNVTQYNYGLTGGTATYTGLKSFQDNLANHDDDSADKYLIIFTDGKDSTEKQAESEKIANELKKDGYTIFAVMLTGGSVEYSNEESSEYQQARKFLLKLVGNSETEAKTVEEGTGKDADDTNVSYFYSTAEEKEGSSIDALTKIFTDEILTKITYNLKNYTVEDYIDPSFDLVSADDSLYKLNADGKITVNKSDGSTSEYDLINGQVSENGEIKEDNSKKYLTINLTNSSKIEESAHNARLYYNNEKKMYYLKWVDQTIPGCIPDAKKLSVWNGRVTIKAKDDFIGGNAVLTNGNEEEMNWVYFDNDNDKSSGTEDSKIDNEDEYPSKGFPRVTVNVPAPTDTFTESNTIYMGENLDKNALSEELMKSTYEKNKNDIKQYYLEYLSRYANKKGKNLDELKQEIILGKKVSIPYYYLPNSKNTNSTGTTSNEKDQLGTLEYQVVSSVEPNGEYGGIVKDRNIRKLTFTVKYTPLIVDVDEANPETSTTDTNTRKKQNDALVLEDKYKWDEDYKPVVGVNVEEKELMKSESTTNEVSGEIALQLVLKKDVRDVIGNNDLTYTIDLVRNYDGKKETVGKFTATYTKDKLPKEDTALNQVNAQEVSEANESVENNEVTNTETEKEEFYKIDEEGNVTILAKLEYNEEYMNTNGLPIGTYTVENPKMSYKKNLKVKLPNIVTEKEEYVQELFTVGNNHEAPQSYLASFENNNEIQLGKTGTDKTYTDYRFGLLRVTPFTYYQIPKTGSSSLVILYGFIAIFATVGISMEIKKNKRNRNTK